MAVRRGRILMDDLVVSGCSAVSSGDDYTVGSITYPGWQPQRSIGIDPEIFDRYRGLTPGHGWYTEPTEEVQEMSDKKQIWEVVIVWEDCDGEEDFTLTVVRERSREVAIAAACSDLGEVKIIEVQARLFG